MDFIVWNINDQFFGFSFAKKCRLKSFCVSLCARAGQDRKKPDRVVFDCQERAYWIVHRPPVSVAVTASVTDPVSLTQCH